MSAPAEQLRPLPRLPTEDDLPSDDGIPMETPRHRMQMELLIRGLEPWAAARGDVFVSGNQFVYFSAAQLRGEDFRGPDVFVVTGTPRRERKSWVVWDEGKAPDVVIELISESTARFDKTTKMAIYRDRLRVSDYIWADPFDLADRAAFSLHNGQYVPHTRDAVGCLPVPSLGLRLCIWHGTYLHVTTDWLRWADADDLLPFPEEIAQREAATAQQAAVAAQRAAAAAQQTADAAQRAAELAAQRADSEHQRADSESHRADAAEREVQRLLDTLSSLQRQPDRG